MIIKKNKIIHYSFLFYPHLGGLSTHIDSLVSNMLEFKHEIITNYLPNTKFIERYSENVLIRRYKPINYYHYPRGWMRLKSHLFFGACGEILRTINQTRYLKNSDFDILHVHETNHELTALDMKLNTNFFSKISQKIYDFNKFKKPLVFTKHYLPVKNIHHPKFIEWDYNFSSKFENIICVDRFIFENLTQYFESTKQHKNIWFIPNSIDIKHFNYIKQENGEKLKVGIVGRLSSETGKSFIMDFLKQIPDFIEIHWVTSERETRIEELKKAITIPNVHIYSNVEYNYMPKFYNNIEVLFNPVEFQYNVTRVTLEAMACGRPVIMFTGSRYPLINQKNGFIIKRDVNALLSLLSDLYFERNRLNKMGEESRNIIEQEFTTEIIIPKIKKVYDIIRE